MVAAARMDWVMSPSSGDALLCFVKRTVPAGSKGIAADAKAIAFGNFKRGYTIVDRIGTRILRDPYTNKPFVGFYTTKRTGGMLVDSQAIKLLKIAAA